MRPYDAMYRPWCWFCWRVTNSWWPFRTWPQNGIARIYWWMLPFAGDYIYLDPRKN